MKIILTKSCFCIPLTKKQWNALDERVGGNCYSNIHMPTRFESTSKEMTKLLESGCDDIDWDGHFGRNFFFSAKKNDIIKVQKAVIKFFDKITKNYNDRIIKNNKKK